MAPDARLSAAAAQVQQHVAAEWQQLQEEFARFDAGTPYAASRLRRLEARRHALAAQVELLAALAEQPAAPPDLRPAFEYLIGLLDFSEVPLPDTPLTRRLAKWQAHADYVQSLRAAS